MRRRATDLHPTIIREEEEEQLKFKRDPLNMWIGFSNGAVWAFICVQILLLDIARPQGTKVLDIFFDVQRRDYWDVTTLTNLFYVSVMLFLFAVVSLIVNSFRLKRKGDRIRISLIVALGASLIGIVSYVIFYYRNLV